MQNRLLAAILLPLLLLTACTPNVRLTCYSDPDGASVYVNGQKVGEAPITLSWPQQVAEQAGGSLTFQNFRAVWPSGATVDTGPVYLDVRNGGYNHTHNFMRPADVPGRAQDVAYALEKQKLKIMREQAEAAEDAALAAQQQLGVSIYGAMQAAQPSP